jgi:hypothetical protein
VDKIVFSGKPGVTHTNLWALKSYSHQSIPEFCKAEAPMSLTNRVSVQHLEMYGIYMREK